MTQERPDHLQIGIVRRAHGVRGELRVEPTTDQPELRFAPDATLGVGDGEYTVESARAQPDGSWLVKLVGVDSRAAADALRGVELSVPREGGELMRDDLVGYEVYAGGKRIGAVGSVENTGSNDILVVGHGVAELLVPLVENLGVTLDPPARRVLIDDLKRIT
jgi:16S rRNA processing protein RimM